MALITTLLLRGAQTPGELRSRAANVNSAIWRKWSRRWNNWQIAKMVLLWCVWPANRVNRNRYMHLFSGEVEDQPAVTDMSNAVDGDLQARVEATEIEVAELKQRLDSLLAHLGD